MEFEGFDWGSSNEWYQKEILKEFIDKKIYSKYFNVNEGDLVVDLGASIGPFGYTIKNKNPKLHQKNQNL